MDVSQQQSMDFDRWSALARHNPEAFEAMRLAAISALIETTPPQSRGRLRRLQWRIDQERRLCSSSLGACIRISSMMWDSLAGSGGLLEQLEQLRGVVGGRPEPMADSCPKAKVISLSARRG